MNKILKNVLHYVAMSVICIVAIVIYHFSTAPGIVGIKKSESNGLYDTYTVTYSDGTKDTITVKNGEDAPNISIEDLYAKAKEEGGYGDDYSILDFLQDYLTVNVTNSNADKSYAGVFSSVAVSSEFKVKGSSVLPFDFDYEISYGSGVIYRPSGAKADDYYIITNYHVVYSNKSVDNGKIASKINVYLYGASHEVKNSAGSFVYPENAIACSYVGGSMKNDIAVLKVNDASLIKNSNSTPVTVSTTGVSLGQTIAAIGNSDGAGISYTKGVVSVDSEYINMTAVDNASSVTFRVFRFDAPVNPGNSGGGIFNSSGELVGISNAKMIRNEIEGMAYALPADLVIKVADNIIKNNSNPVKPNLKIKYTTKNGRVEYNASTLSVTIKEDVYVDVVNSDSVCYNKLLKGDRVVSIIVNGLKYTIDRLYKAEDLVWDIKPDSVIIFEIQRKSLTLNMNVVVDSTCFSVVA